MMEQLRESLGMSEGVYSEAWKCYKEVVAFLDGRLSGFKGKDKNAILMAVSLLLFSTTAGGIMGKVESPEEFKEKVMGIVGVMILKVKGIIADRMNQGSSSTVQ
jgi:hypothetical protein